MQWYCHIRPFRPFYILSQYNLLISKDHWWFNIHWSENDSWYVLTDFKMGILIKLHPSTTLADYGCYWGSRSLISQFLHFILGIIAITLHLVFPKSGPSNIRTMISMMVDSERQLGHLARSMWEICILILRGMIDVRFCRFSNHHWILGSHGTIPISHHL